MLIEFGSTGWLKFNEIGWFCAICDTLHSVLEQPRLHDTRQNLVLLAVQRDEKTFPVVELPPLHAASNKARAADEVARRTERICMTSAEGEENEEDK